MYGQNFTIETDHQKLKENFDPSKDTPPVAVSRLQLWSLILSIMYNYKMLYRRGRMPTHYPVYKRNYRDNDRGIPNEFREVLGEF